MQAQFWRSLGLGHGEEQYARGRNASLSINEDFISAPDGTRIAYRAEGEGPAFMLTNGLTTTTTFWDHVRPRWLSRHRVVTWDLPGHGHSSPAATGAGARIEALPGIVARVMEAAGISRATHIGWSTGCQVMFETYRQYPERCEALVALLGPAGKVLDTTELPVGGVHLYRLIRHLPPAVFAPIFRLLAKNADAPSGPSLGKRLRLIGRDTTTHDARRILAHLRLLDAPTLQCMARSAQEHSAHDILGRIGVPVLVVAGDRDPFAPAERVGVPLHRAIARSELLRLPKGTHTALLDHAQVIAERVEEFVARSVPSASDQTFAAE
jgi:pimeloyl-ACP methyl ester carboxylesterase